MKNVLPIIIVLVVIAALVFVVYKYAIKPPATPLDIVIPETNVNPTNGSLSLSSQFSAETLGKIQTACSTPTSKVWFENLYKTKCANFGF